MMRLKELGSWGRALTQPVTYLGLLALVITGVVLVHLTNQQRNYELEDAVRDNANLSLLLEKHVATEISKADSVLMLLRALYQNDPAKFNLYRWVHDVDLRKDITYRVSIVGPDGFLKATSLGPVKRDVYVGDLKSFITHAYSTHDKLYIGKPTRVGASGKWLIKLTRRITEPDGSFGGIVTASLDPLHLIPDSIDLRHDGVATVIGFDKTVRLRYANGKVDKGSFGKSVDRMGLLKRVERARSGHFWTDAGDGGHRIERLVDYRAVEGFPLVVAVGQTKKAVLGDLSDTLHFYYGIGALLTVSVLIAIAFGAVRERKLSDATSEIRRAKEALESSEQRYQFVEQAVNNGIWDRNLVTDEVYHSPRWKEICGYDDNDAADRLSSFLELIHPDDRAVVNAASRARVEEGKPFSSEFRIRHKSGTYIWVRSDAKVMCDASGRPVRMIGSLVDISERVRAKVELEESNARLARAEALAGLGHYKCDHESNACEWSEGTYRVMGQSPNTFTPGSDCIPGLIHPDDRAKLERCHDDVRAGGESASATLRVIRNTGEIAYVEFWLVPVRAPDGRVTGVFGTIQDVTERRQTQALITEANQNLARAEEMARLGHIKFDQKAKEYTWSKGVYRIMDKAPGLFIPTPESTLDLVHPDDRRALESHRRDVMAGLDTPLSTLRVITQAGGCIHVEYLSAPLRDSDGTITGMFSSIQDVTPRKVAEQALAKVNRELAESQFAIDQAVTVAITDVKGNITHVNDRLCEVSGHSREDLLGANHRIMKSGIHSKAFFREMYRQIAHGRIWRGEICNRAKDGSLYWVDTTIVPKLREDGRPIAYMAIRIDITARKQAEERISYLADHDALTGLGNRTALNRQLEEALTQAQRSRETFAVLLLDLDGFKHVNDTLGHAAGDALLQELALRLKSTLHEADFLARLGGDEFAIIQKAKTNQREAAIGLAVKLLEIAAEPFRLEGHDVAVGTSIGIAIAYEDGATPGDLLQRADLALYHVKSEGRNDFCFFDNKMSEGAADRLQLINDMRLALNRDEFELHYQAIFDAKTLRPCCAEALIRWRHPVKGLILPDHFIPLAEEAGFLEPLGAWILEQACKDAMSWPDDVKVAVNLSAAQFRSGKLFDVILCALVESGLPAERLELEITETTLMQNAEDNGVVMQQLKNIGVSIALDDFGTGYSSLSYLTTFPFDKIKIDKSFTQGLMRHTEHAAIVASILTLARGLDMTVTAEGVETEHEFELLKAAGAHQIQGYLLARPCPANELSFPALEQKGKAVVTA